MDELINQIEAILFAASRAVSKEELKRFCGALSDEEIENAANLLKKRLDEVNSALILVPESNGWKLAVREKYTQPLQKIVPNTELNRAVLETLAIIAWKQPLLQSKVVDMRTTKAYEHIAELETLGFITREKQGRSFVLKTSRKFSEYFELPENEPMKEILKNIQQTDIPHMEEDKKNKEKHEEKRPKIQTYNLENQNIQDGKEEFEIYETGKETEKKKFEKPKEEFYEKIEENEGEVKKEKVEKKEVYIDLGQEEEGKEQKIEEMEKKETYVSEIKENEEKLVEENEKESKESEEEKLPVKEAKEKEEEEEYLSDEKIEANRKRLQDIKKVSDDDRKLDHELERMIDDEDEEKNKKKEKDDEDYKEPDEEE